MPTEENTLLAQAAEVVVEKRLDALLDLRVVVGMEGDDEVARSAAGPPARRHVLGDEGREGDPVEERDEVVVVGGGAN